MLHLGVLLPLPHDAFGQQDALGNRRHEADGDECRRDDRDAANGACEKRSRPVA